MSAPAARGRRALVLRVWGNPLARGIDRAESALVAGLVLIWLLILPLVATVASTAWTGVDARLTEEQLSGTYTDAVLTDDSTLVMSARDIPMGASAPAEWTTPDGGSASGVIDVLGGARSGSHVTIWLAPDGTVADPPMSAAAAATLTAVMAGASWLALGLVLVGVWWAVRCRLDRRRADRWEREWAVFAPGSKSS